jgi:hypothetical protein
MHDQRHDKRHDKRQDGARHPVDLPVYIRYRKRRFLGTRVHDISVDGMSLSVRSLTLPIGTPVELEFRAGGKGWLVQAIVAQGNNSGIDLMFRESQTALFADMTRQLGEMPPLVGAGAASETRPSA